MSIIVTTPYVSIMELDIDVYCAVALLRFLFGVRPIPTPDGSEIFK